MHLGRHHRVVLRQEQLQPEHSSLVAAALGSLDGDVEVTRVVGLGDGGDADDGILGDALRLLDDATRQLSSRARHDGGGGGEREGGRMGGGEAKGKKIRVEGVVKDERSVK